MYGYVYIGCIVMISYGERGWFVCGIRKYRDNMAIKNNGNYIGNVIKVNWNGNRLKV